MSISFGEVYVLFTNKTSLTGDGEIKPRWSDSKTFTIESKSNGTYNYNIVFSDLINPFVTNESLQILISFIV